jgi:hypothetical protein
LGAFLLTRPTSAALTAGIDPPDHDPGAFYLLQSLLIFGEWGVVVCR